MRRSPYGERGLKSCPRWARTRYAPGRSPYGERGLKFVDTDNEAEAESRSPYGERGLKCIVGIKCRSLNGRSPYGERGLKYADPDDRYRCGGSLSLRRAWIEIRW